MFRYDAVLFDMDGTLLNTVDDIAGALNQTLADYGYPTHGRDAVTGFLGNGARKLIRRALPEYTEDEAMEQVLAAYLRLYGKHHHDKTHPFPGVLPMLTALDEAGLKLAVISNKGDETVKKLTKTYFGSLIHTTIGARDGVPLKPEPDMLCMAMRELHTTPERTLYIGDAPTDFFAAQNADTDCILARWGYGDPGLLKLLTPLYFVNDPAELPMLIMQEEEDAP